MTSVLALIPATIVLSCLHEAWHWLAGRAIGLPAVFRVSYRGIFLVFETDLSQIVTVPRRRRYGPFLAGMAFDTTVLAAFLLLRLAYHESWLSFPPLVDRLLGALVLRQVFAIVWQVAAVFLRNDMYAILTTALRCTNMYRVNALTIKDRLASLTPDEARELAEASDRDRAVAPWFAAIYLAGMVAMIWLFLVAGLPNLIALVGWLANSVAAHAAGSLDFWKAIAVAGYLVVTLALPAVLAVRERRMRRRGALS
jgi:putative peptide zinc metalloprotease protein